MPRLLADTLTIECGCIATVGPYGSVVYNQYCDEHDPTSEYMRRMIYSPFLDTQEIEWT